MLNAMMDVRISPRYPTALRSPLCAANSLYAVARKRARQGQFWSSLTRRSRGLLALKQVSEACTVQAQSDGGVRTVPIGQIRGSEDRSRDFDRDFNPLQDHCKGRWLNIAVARQQGEALPLVALIQVGEIYFVKDGHHRISVARALGQLDIEAKVNVWQVSGPLPWETPTRAPHQATTGRVPGIERIFQKLRREGSRLWERIVLGVQVLGHRQGSPERHGHSVTGG
jgi:hypothetical protein